MNRKFEKITDAKGGAALAVRVTTRAEQHEVVGIEENALRVRLALESAGGQAANDVLLALLAEALQVDVSQLDIVAGADGRDKIISVEGLSAQDVQTRLQG